jgi:DNA modification methylase
MVNATPAELLAIDLDFHREVSTYSSHALHAFAAKFPPQIPAAFIERLTKPGETVLDPFAGIGSTGYVAIQNGREFVGIELKRSYWKAAVQNIERADSRMVLGLAG